jgi:predicted dithiol-disulfide oxidoreductase (DUF899 family)
MTHTSTEPHAVVSREEWLAARRRHLAREKELMRLTDELAAERRALPWVRVDKPYLFDGPDGEETLSDLFAGRSQLIVYHFMFAPGQTEGCVGCSFVADHVDGAAPHVNARDITLVVCSRAPLAQIEVFRRRMGWRFKWVSSHRSDFNSDFHVSFTSEDLAKGPTYYNFEKRTAPSVGEAPGLSVFYQDAAGVVFHTYSAYARGLEVLDGAYHFIDLAPKGRDEGGLPFPGAWWRHHDRYASDAISPEHAE